jgi:hypothetical protein
MRVWPSIEVDGIEYTFEHLKGKEFSYTRPATEKYPAKVTRFYIEYGDHCFTEHYGEVEYTHGNRTKPRYFCKTRYEHSKNIFELIKKVIGENVFMKRTFNEHREQFFYLEEHYGLIEYRLFLEVSKSNHPNSDVRIKIVSAYEPRPESDPIGGNDWFKFLSIVDSRINGTKLQKRRR